MGMMIEFQSHADGKTFRASIIPVKKTFLISGSSGMPFLDVKFDSRLEIAVYEKNDSSLGFLRMLLPPNYLVEVDDYLNPLTADEWPIFCQAILRAENVLYTDMDSEELGALQEKWEVTRVTDKKTFIPYFRKVPIAFYMRRTNEEGLFGASVSGENR